MRCLFGRTNPLNFDSRYWTPLRRDLEIDSAKDPWAELILPVPDGQVEDVVTLPERLERHFDAHDVAARPDRLELGRERRQLRDGLPSPAQPRLEEDLRRVLRVGDLDHVPERFRRGEGGVRPGRQRGAGEGEHR